MKLDPSRLVACVAAAALATACTAEELDADDLGEAEADLTYACGGEGNCQCSVVLNNVIEGLPYNNNHLQSHLGPADPLDLFGSGGSENIPVICRTAKYLLDHDVAWLDRYVDVQLQPGSPRVFNGEVFSSTYAAQVIGSLMVALDHARARGHTAFVTRASRLLRAYWTVLALAAIDRDATGFVAHNWHGTVTAGATAIDRGYSLGLVGLRAYVNGHGGNATSVPADGLQPLLLSMALQHPRRAFPWSLNNSPGFYGGLRAALLAAGYALNANNGKLIGALNGRSVPPAFFGLTAGERAALHDYVASGGTQGVATLRGYLDGVELRCELTVIRTAGGVLTWWGRSDARVAVCPSGKGGTWAVAKTQTDGVATFLSRATGAWGQFGRGEVWRDGASVCAEGNLPELCLDIPAGTFRNELRLGGGSAVCVAGCGGSPAPAPWPPRGWLPREPNLPMP